MLILYDTTLEQYNEYDEVIMMAYKSENSKTRFFDPVASFMLEGSSLAIARTLQSSQFLTQQLASTLAVDKLDRSTSTINAHSAASSAQMGETRQSEATVAHTMTDDDIHFIDRADTEAGLKLTQTSRAISSQAKAGGQAPRYRRSRSDWITTWNSLCFLFIFQTGLLTFIAISLTRAVGDTASFVALIITFITTFLIAVQFVVEAALERRDIVEANVSMNAKAKKMNKGSLDR